MLFLYKISIKSCDNACYVYISMKNGVNLQWRRQGLMVGEAHLKGSVKGSQHF